MFYGALKHASWFVMQWVTREVYCARIGGFMVTNGVQCTVCMERRISKKF